MRSGGVVCLARGLAPFRLFIFAVHDAKDLGVTPMDILQIARLKALSTALLVNPGSDHRMGFGRKGTI